MIHSAVTGDIGVVCTFQVFDQRSLQLRGEAFDFQNRANLFNPKAAMNSPRFGQITRAADPRIIQLALKYTF